LQALGRLATLLHVSTGMEDPRPGLTGSAVALLTVVWLVGSGAVVGWNASRSQASEQVELAPIPWERIEVEPAPARLPAQIVFATDIRPSTGEAIDPALSFAPDATVAFTVWLGVPVGVATVTLELDRIPVDGSAKVPVWNGRPLDVNTRARFVIGELPVDAIAAEQGLGIYHLEVHRDRTRLAVGTFQIGSVPAELRIFTEARPVTFAAGEHSGLRFDDAGEVLAEKPYSLGGPSTLSATASGRFGEQEYVLIASGARAGYWFAVSERVQLAPEPDV